LEWQLTGKVQKKVEGFGEDFVAQFGSKIEESQESNQSWRTPFYILLGLLLLGGIGLVFFYRKLVSHHIL
jgi:LPXTG-motif cell wall-anchored protein